MTIKCVLCKNDTPIEFDIANLNIKLPGEVYSFWMKKHGENTKEGFLCINCFSLLQGGKIKKIVKETIDFNNSSAVILPKEWFNKKVVVYLLE